MIVISLLNGYEYSYLKSLQLVYDSNNYKYKAVTTTIYNLKNEIIQNKIGYCFVDEKDMYLMQEGIEVYSQAYILIDDNDRISNHIQYSRLVAAHGGRNRKNFFDNISINQIKNNSSIYFKLDSYLIGFDIMPCK